MEDITVFLLNTYGYNRDQVTKMSFQELMCLWEEDIDGYVKKYNLQEFQAAFNEDMIDEVNSWIVFSKP